MGMGTGESDVFNAISASTRREILGMLAEGERPMTEIAEAFEMTLSAVSQHLAVLRSANLVAATRRGRQQIYRLTAEPLADVAAWAERYEKFWPSRLDRLGRYLETHEEQTQL